MESFEALRRAVASDAAKVARRLGLSVSTVYKWCESTHDFSESGARNPLDRLEDIIDVSVKQGRAARDAYAPIFYLAHQVGGVFLPPVPRTIETFDISKQLCRVIKEAGEAFTAAAEALEDDDLSPAEIKRILKEVYEAQAEFATLARLMECQK